MCCRTKGCELFLLLPRNLIEMGGYDGRWILASPVIWTVENGQLRQRSEGYVLEATPFNPCPAQVFGRPLSNFGVMLLHPPPPCLTCETSRREAVEAAVENSQRLQNSPDSGCFEKALLITPTEVTQGRNEAPGSDRGEISPLSSSPGCATA